VGAAAAKPPVPFGDAVNQELPNLPINPLNDPRQGYGFLTPPLTNAYDLQGIKSPSDAPQQINLGSGLQGTFDILMEKSYPLGNSQEQGGTFVFDQSGAISLTNIGGRPGALNSSTFPVDLNVGSGQNLFGFFHTHPYATPTDSQYVTGISLSGGDAAYTINNGLTIGIAQSGDEQFAFVRTSATPSSVNFNAVNNAQNARINTLVQQGNSFALASRIAAAETANKYGLAYYEGSKNVFTRVGP
jgi:hypothetical protein